MHNDTYASSLLTTTPANYSDSFYRRQSDQVKNKQTKEQTTTKGDSHAKAITRGCTGTASRSTQGVRILKYTTTQFLRKSIQPNYFILVPCWLREKGILHAKSSMRTEFCGSLHRLTSFRISE